MTTIRYFTAAGALCATVACGSGADNASRGDASAAAVAGSEPSASSGSTPGSASVGVTGANAASCSVAGSPNLYGFYTVQNSAGPGTPVGQQTLALIFSSDPQYCSAFAQGILPGSTLYTVEASQGSSALVNAQSAVTVSQQLMPTNTAQCLAQRPANGANYSSVSGTLTSQTTSMAQALSVSIEVPQQGSTQAFTLSGVATQCSASTYPAIGGTADSSNGTIACRGSGATGGNAASLYSFYSLQDSAGPNTDPNEQTLAVVFSSDANYCTSLSNGILANSTLYTAIAPQGTTSLANSQMSVYFLPQTIAASGQSCLEEKPQAYTYANSSQAMMTSQLGTAAQTLNVTLDVPQQGTTAAFTLQGVATQCADAEYPAVGGTADSNAGALPCRSN